MTEQVPTASSWVRLTGRRDSFGVPTPELDWQLTDADRQSVTRSQQLITSFLDQAINCRVDSLLCGEPPRVFGGSHQMGTTRMAASVKDGVVDVDVDCRVHGMSNLNIAGASVFPAVAPPTPP